MSGTGLERKRSCPDQDTLSVFAWRDRKRTRKSSERPVRDSKEHLPPRKKSRNLYLHNNLDIKNVEESDRDTFYHSWHFLETLRITENLIRSASSLTTTQGASMCQKSQCVH